MPDKPLFEFEALGETFAAIPSTDTQYPLTVVNSGQEFYERALLSLELACELAMNHYFPSPQARWSYIADQLNATKRYFTVPLAAGVEGRVY